MAGRRGSLAVGLAVAFAVAGGTAWAIDQSDDSGPAAFVTPTGVLAHGTAPSGGDYTISRLEPDEFGVDATQALCVEIRTPAAASQGCKPLPDKDGWIDGQPFRPSMSLLGTDRFFTTLAPEGVTAMEVNVAGESQVTRSQSIDAGSLGRLLVVKLGGPQVTSRDAVSSRDYEVRLLDANGETILETTASDPG